jgi:exosome complex exonuclease DIS3/RRP44
MQAQRVLFSPEDKKVPYIRIQTRQLDALMDQRIVVAIDAWPVDSRYPTVCPHTSDVSGSARAQGHYVRTVGPIGDRETETEVVLIEHQIPYAPFSQAVLKSACHRCSSCVDQAQ